MKANRVRQWALTLAFIPKMIDKHGCCARMIDNRQRDHSIPRDAPTAPRLLISADAPSVTDPVKRLWT